MRSNYFTYNIDGVTFQLRERVGNIHIITSTKREVISALKDVSLGRTQTNANLEMFSGSESIFEELEKTKNIYYLGESRPGWISVLNDSFEWGEVEAFGEQLSRMINSPVLTISYFDDDLLELNFFSNGELQTGHIWCSEETREAYGLEEKSADISVLSQYIGYHDINRAC